MVWRSSDGVEWSASTLPTIGPDIDGLRALPFAVAGTDDLVVALGRPGLDVQQLIAEVLPEGYDPSALNQWGIRWGGPPFRVTVYGPLGIPVLDATAQDLGLDDEQLGPLFAEPQNTGVWLSPDGENWDVYALDNASVQSVVSTPQGTILATGHGGFGVASWDSSDGIVWREQSSPGSPDRVVSWSGGLIAVNSSVSTNVLKVSVTGQEWAPVDVSDLLSPELSWHVGDISAGDAGFTAIAHGIDRTPTFVEPDPVRLERGDIVLVTNRARSAVILSRDDEEILRIPSYLQTVPDDVRVDFVTETITFFEPGSESPLVTFTFDEIDQPQQVANPAIDIDDTQLLLHATDVTNWQAEPLDKAFGPDRQASMVRVANNRLVAVVTEQPAPWFAPPEPSVIELWSAPLP